MSPILHALNAKPIDLSCTSRRIIKPNWVETYGQATLNRIYAELKVLDFFLNDDFKQRTKLRSAGNKYPHVLSLCSRGLLERDGNSYRYRTTDAGWEYMRAHALNASQRETIEVGNCMPVSKQWCA